MVTALDPTAMDMMAMVSINDMHLCSVYRFMLGLLFLKFSNATKLTCK